MSKIFATNDLSTNGWTVTTESIAPTYTDLHIGFTGQNINIEFSQLKFGYELRRGASIIQSQQWPPPNVVYKRTDQQYIAFDRLRFSGGSALSLLLWMDVNGERFEQILEFVAPDDEESKAQAAMQRADALIKRKEIDAVLETLPDEEVETLTYLYPRWEPDKDVVVDDKLRYRNILYKVIQPHTTQADWAPPQVPNLFVRFREPTGGVMEWVAGEEVAAGDQRTYQGTTYEALQAHTTQAGWEPDATPSLWSPV